MESTWIKYREVKSETGETKCRNQNGRKRQRQEVRRDNLKIKTGNNSTETLNHDKHVAPINILRSIVSNTVMPIKLSVETKIQ